MDEKQAVVSWWSGRLANGQWLIVTCILASAAAAQSDSDYVTPLTAPRHAGEFPPYAEDSPPTLGQPVAVERNFPLPLSFESQPAATASAANQRSSHVAPATYERALGNDTLSKTDANVAGGRPLNCPCTCLVIPTRHLTRYCGATRPVVVR